MIVDDEPEVLEKVKLFLKNDEFDVVTVSSSRQALELLEEKNEDIDLILVDTPVPGGNTNGFFSLKPKSTMHSADTDTFLQKPFTREQLHDFVKNSI